MLEANINYFPEKKQSYCERNIDTILKDYGFSSYGFGINYNLYNSILKEIEYTLGLQVDIPFEINNDKLPQHIASSTGAVSLGLKSFFHKGFNKSDLHFFLINHLNYFFENNQHYQYGVILTSSFFITKLIIENLSAFFEIRNELRSKDYKENKTLNNTGSSIFYISPQLNYTLYGLNISVFYDYPFYQLFNGSQLGINYSLGINLTYQTKIKY